MRSHESLFPDLHFFAFFARDRVRMQSRGAGQSHEWPLFARSMLDAV